MRHFRLTLAATVVATVATLATPVGGQLQHTEAKRFIADQLAAVYAWPSSQPRLRPDLIEVDSAFTFGNALTVWRGWYPLQSEPRQFLFAYLPGSDHPVRLGGFPACRIEELSEAAPASIQTVAAAILRSHELIRAADSDGAREVMIPFGSLGASALPNRISRMPQYWPADTARALGDGSYYVRRTALSHITLSGYGHPWYLTSYAFIIDARGRVLSWIEVDGGTVSLSEVKGGVEDTR